MDEKDPKDSVRDEQFAANEKSSEDNLIQQPEVKSELPESDLLPETPALQPENVLLEEPPAEGKLDGDSENREKPEIPRRKSRFKTGNRVIIPAEPGAETHHLSEYEQVKKNEDIELPPVDYSGSSKTDLAATLELIIENRPPNEIKDDVERIKSFFYKKIKLETEERKKKFLEEGGKAEDYRIYVDPLEHKVKEMLEKYRSKRTDFGKIQEAEKNENLKKKYDIIDKIKDLVNREESINKTFQEFRALQNEFHLTGIVPQNTLKDLWENYNHSVEIFYDYIKINKELRDLDLRKNLEKKVNLCEKAEELLLEPNPVASFRALQDYHNSWREIGPVPNESKNEIWERFREATTKINKRHHDYFESQKDEQKRNLDAKTALCEKVEELINEEFATFKDFDEKAKMVVDLQKMWRTIGFAPMKQNTKIYQRFREACDAFFEKKRSYYAESKEIQMNNLQLKTDLCMQAETLQESSDWKSATDAIIKLQKEWKEIGPVPRKHSEKIWRRFRKACDQFFKRKAEYFSGLDSSYEDNLKAKEAIIEELDSFKAGNDVQAAFNRLKEIQKRWTDLGFVPLNRKEEINNRYRNALNKQFDMLKIGEDDRNLLRYRTKLETLKTNPRSIRKLDTERDRFVQKIKQLENDIVLWENNIGFFAKSASADNLIREVKEKVSNARKTIKTLEEKVRLIDQMDSDD